MYLRDDDGDHDEDEDDDDGDDDGDNGDCDDDAADDDDDDDLDDDDDGVDVVDDDHDDDGVDVVVDNDDEEDDDGVGSVDSIKAFVNTRGVWAQAKLPLPGQALYDRMCRQHDRLAHKQATFPDITCTPEVLEHLSFRIHTLPRALHAEDKSFDGGPQLPATAPCPLPQHALLHCFSHTSTLWQECGTANSATGYVTAGST